MFVRQPLALPGSANNAVCLMFKKLSFQLTDYVVGLQSGGIYSRIGLAWGGSVTPVQCGRGSTNSNVS